MSAIREQKLAKAAGLRERAERLDQQISARIDAGDSKAAGTCGPGGARPTALRRPGAQARADRRRNASDERTWAMMRERDQLRAEAEALELAAKTQVFADDVEGLQRQVANEQRLVDWCDAALRKGTPERERAAARGMDDQFLRESRREHRRKLKAAQARLDRAEAVVA